MNNTSQSTNTSTRVAEPFLGYCRTEPTLMTFHYTWEISNFWETYRIMFPIDTKQHDDEPFYFRLNYDEDKEHLELHLYCKIRCKCICTVTVSPSHIPCLTKKVVRTTYLGEASYLCNFPITSLSSHKYACTPGEILTLCFQCKWCPDITLTTMYTTISQSCKNSELLPEIDPNGSDTSNIKSIVTFVIDNKRLYAHKDLICKKSSVFQTMFICDMEEKETNEVQITDIKYDILKLFLIYLEFDLLPDTDSDTVEILSDLFVVADKYDIQDLRLHCEIRLMRLVHVTNYAIFLSEPWLDNTIYLKNYIQKFIKIRTEDRVNFKLTDLIEQNSDMSFNITKYDKVNKISSSNTVISKRTISRNIA